MSEYLCHDFKTPRTDTARRLPDTFRFIPILFYVAMLGGGYMMTMDYLSYGKAKRDKQEADDRRKALETERDGYNTELSTLETETAKAEVVAKWMEGARNMQPVVVKIARAVQQDTRLGELVLERSEEIPSNISMSLRVTGEKASNELLAIEGSISQLQYRTYSPQQTRSEDVIEYRATLVRASQ
ncbi:MAG: hypothetical protein RLZZ476_1255 [Verrucomicrobiota bacterium]|jgi:hypothetical protein